jgi:hypothetical protein
MTVNTFGPINTDGVFLNPEQDYPEDNDLMREILANRARITADVVNLKETAQYEKVETLTGQQYFTAVSNGAQRTSYGFRLTFDLVSLNGGSIGAGTTMISLPTDPTVNVPTCIQYANGLVPLHGFGGCTAGGVYYFINDPSVFVEFTNTSITNQIISITNNTGSDITQCYWVFEYLKT